MRNKSIRKIWSGTKFGRLTVRRLQAHPEIKKAHYLCDCSCGGEILVRGSSLRLGRTKSCGCLRTESIRQCVQKRTSIAPSILQVGDRFSRLTITRFDHWDSAKHRSFYVCRCDCGESCVQDNVRLKAGSVRSCGCLKREATVRRNMGTKRTHGMSKSAEYKAWRAMKNRCGNSSVACFKHYGGRGISVCVRWMKSFENFYADMGPRPPKMSLDRIDVNGNYEPQNCRWADTVTQRNNQRPRTQIENFSDEELLREVTRRGLLG